MVKAVADSLFTQLVKSLFLALFWSPPALETFLYVFINKIHIPSITNVCVAHW